MHDEVCYNSSSFSLIRNWEMLRSKKKFSLYALYTVISDGIKFVSSLSISCHSKSDIH